MCDTLPVDQVAHVVDGLVQDGTIPSAAVAIRVEGQLVLHHTAGLARLRPARPAVPGQPYDLASLTKPLAGALAAAALVERRWLSLDTPLCRWFPELDERMRVGHLLQHTSGLPAWAPLHERVPRALWGTPQGRAQLLQKVRAVPLQGEPGKDYVYSDLGFLLLLEVMERVANRRLDEQLADWPGGDLRWGWPGAAATEDRPDRGGVIEGVVHDPLAFAMGGISSHAGLFGTALSVCTLAEQVMDAWAGRLSPLPAVGLRALAQLERAGAGKHVGGWAVAEPGGSSGRYWPHDGRGHLGYTGTSVWTAPRQRVVVALLTNRVHPRDDLTAIRAARPRVHDAVATALGWDRERP
jgi:CubicO group peptidase (beta-lactamase class C family)